jgi:hypothetical protein
MLLCPRYSFTRGAYAVDMTNKKAPVFLQRLHTLGPANYLDRLNTATFLAV